MPEDRPFALARLAFVCAQTDVATAPPPLILALSNLKAHQGSYRLGVMLGDWSPSNCSEKGRRPSKAQSFAQDLAADFPEPARLDVDLERRLKDCVKLLGLARCLFADRQISALTTATVGITPVSQGVI